jgi:hypothetical protein
VKNVSADDQHEHRLIGAELSGPIAATNTTIPMNARKSAMARSSLQQW